ncbi:hypothetical protein DFH06DRAFT_1307943 [Mycena polygramma]|nr:hypothetical protein DFH06DRAFT_1307943 [Mycena polygramma]
MEWLIVTIHFIIRWEAAGAPQMLYGFLLDLISMTPSNNSSLRLGSPFTMASPTDTLHGKPAASGNEPQLQQAIEALKPKVPPATDKKTNFWNLYKTLADEHDKEFHQRYSTDLDTSLIFAGLFSAIDSAFIIQVQPQIQFHGTPLILVVAQSLFYISLGSTLLAALLAVLGKQWLMFYSAAGERGTMEARCLERQRKLDGLRKWKFETILQMFPLLLQFGLLLFASALSVYLWTIHIPLAIIVLGLTCLGSSTYIFLLASTLVSPDSPFQTPLAPLLAWLIPTTCWMKLRGVFGSTKRKSLRLIRQAFSGYHVNFLPPFSTPRSPHRVTRRFEPAPLFDAGLPDCSPEAPAVAWVLETSTDPHLVTVAAEMSVALQWTGTTDLRPQLTRLRDSILACFDFTPLGASGFRLDSIREGMSVRTIHLARAFCTLRCIQQSRSDRDFEPRVSWFEVPNSWFLLSGLNPELANVLRILEVKPDLHMDPDASLATEWALYVIPLMSHRYNDSDSRLRAALDYFLRQFDQVIPNLDPSSFTNYLFCINSFLCTMSRRDMVWKDKSQFQAELFEHLFETLALSLQARQLSMDTAANIIYTTGRVSSESANNVWVHDFHNQRRQSIVYRFCSSIPQSDGWLGATLSIGLLVGSHNYLMGHRISRDPRWIYKALENVAIPAEDHDRWDSRTVSGVSSLLDALLCHGAPPTKDHIHVLLQALSIPGDLSENARLLLRGNALTWLSQDDELWTILQQRSVSPSLVRLGGMNIAPQSFSIGIIPAMAARDVDSVVHFFCRRQGIYSETIAERERFENCPPSRRKYKDTVYPDHCWDVLIGEVARLANVIERIEDDLRDVKRSVEKMRQGRGGERYGAENPSVTRARNAGQYKRQAPAEADETSSKKGEDTGLRDPAPSSRARRDVTKPFVSSMLTSRVESSWGKEGNTEDPAGHRVYPYLRKIWRWIERAYTRGASRNPMRYRDQAGNPGHRKANLLPRIALEMGDMTSTLFPAARAARHSSSSRSSQAGPENSRRCERASATIVQHLRSRLVHGGGDGLRESPDSEKAGADKARIRTSRSGTKASTTVRESSA